MLSISIIQFLLLGLVLIPNVFAQSDYSLDWEVSDDEIRNDKGPAYLSFEALQQWHNTSTGLWETTGWWNGANIMTMIGDLAKADDAEELQDVVSRIFELALLKAPIKNPQPGIENPPLNSTTLVAINATSLETGYAKHLDAVTDKLYITYPPDWHDNHGQFTFPKPSSSHGKNDSSYPIIPDPHDWLDGYYDDDLWWALAWINAYDVTSNATYLGLAEGVFIAVSRTWGTYCSGGIYWNWQKTYVNAIANELFFSAAAHLANRVNGDERRAVYLDWAEKSLNWFMNSGMVNDHGTVNDGLTEDCQNNNKTVWSYNQGVLLGGLAELDRTVRRPKFATSSYLRRAAHLAKAALVALSDPKGVIHDECEPDCGDDGAQFKGIFMRNLLKLNAVAQDDVFEEAIGTNAMSIWKRNRMVTPQGLPVFSVNWAGPWVEPANASTQSSAMDALVAAMVVGV
jgi:predicted alpha-1,6-mannanase (GH76 family)